MCKTANPRIWRVMSVFLAWAFVVCGGVEAGAAEWVVMQLTDNDYNDFAPFADDSNVVWYGHDGSDYEIFFYDGSTTTQLTNNSYDDRLAQIDGSNVAWYGYEGGLDSEIFFYDGSSTTQVTSNSNSDWMVQISGSNLTWEGYDGSDTEIFFWDGGDPNSIPIQITNNGYDDYRPKISGSNITWYGNAEIFFWDGDPNSLPTQITSNSYYEEHAEISGTTVVWDGVRPTSYEIMLWDGNSITELTNDSGNDYYPRIDGPNVVWYGYSGSSNEIYLYDGSTTTNISNSSADDRYPQISGSYVVWSGYVGGASWEIFVHDGTGVTRLTYNSYEDRNAYVSGGRVVWEGHDGNDYEIFMAFLAPTKIYVDENAMGADDGSSWSDAYKYLQDALADPSLAPGDEIWVAEGTYTADTNSSDPNGSGDQWATFQLINGVAVYGGFPLGGGSWNQRDAIFYETVLSGDLDGNDVGDLNDPSRNENSYSVVTGSGTDETAVIDGFVITAGRSPGLGGGGMYNYYGSPSVANCAFWRNTAGGKQSGGAAMYNYHSSPTVTNCEFTCNRSYGGATPGGGGMHNDPSSNPKVTNCVFSGNAGDKGGGMYNRLSNPVITNCTFSGNASAYPYEGGAIYNEWGGDPTLTNCILWGNTGSGGTVESAQIYCDPNSTPVINYTCIEGWTGGLGGTGNIGGDPNFVREPNDGGDGWGVGGNDDFGDLRLLPGSACMDAGDNDSVPADIADLDGDGNTAEPTSRDLEGHLRFIDEPNTVDTGNGTGPIVDMGAYEYILRIYVDDNAASDPGPGNPDVSDPNEDGTWGHPFDAIQEAIDASVHGDTIVVRQGTYSGSGNRDIDFSGKAITVRSIDPNDPNVVASTIIDPNGRVAEPHRGFVFQSGEDVNSVLDGFTITKGYHTTGGGIYCIYSSPTISNCTIFWNSAEEKGGGIFNDNSSPTVTNCEFSRNGVEGGRGGGMCNWDGSSPTITGCTFFGNTASDDGGAMHNVGVSNPTLINCTFVANSVSNNVVFGGGGLFNRDGSSAILANCMFVANMSPKYGGAIYSGASSTLTLTNCTFVANSAINGNALACDSPQQSSPSTVQVSNCIFWDAGDEIWNNDNSAITVTYSNVEGGWAGTGNIDSNPVLTPDGHLHSSSPCINLGDPSFVVDPNAPTDMDGEPRIMNGRVEIGADEFADSDGDGLPDWWEQEHFGGPNTADANADPDGDGINNRDEYELYGSNPNAPPINVPAQLGTIQAAIDAASNGDTVLVAAGTYTGAGNKNLDFGGKSIILIAPSGAGNTIIDCQNSGRGFNFHSGETPASAVIGFKITNGQAGKGGAIIFDHSNPQIRECLITGNTATIQGGGIYSSLSIPTFADCNISDNNAPDIADIWMQYGGAWIVGAVRIEDSNWIGNDITLSGDGTLWMYPGAALNLDESEILCNLAGPVTVQVDVDSELLIEGDAIIDLNNPADPNNKGKIECDGVLRIKDNVQVVNGNINVTRASFEDASTISRNVITVGARAPYGQFFIGRNVTITYNDIYADGDRYMNLDPSIFEGVMQNNRIFVTITEGVGRERGGLFELRGDPNLADPSCDPNYLMCQVGPGTLPDCNVATWTIERLELIEGAKVTLTNRFGFHPPYDFGDEDEVLYVKSLILREDSIFNTSFNYVYYESLIMEPNAYIKNEPLLGFSLSNIALDDQLEFIVRVIHNNFEDIKDPNNNRIHVERVAGLEPDPNGMMRMRNLVDPSTDDVVNARAKGLFAKADEDEILVRFEYLFGSYDPGVELMVYLSDEPELLDYNDPCRADHYLQVGSLRPPPPGRHGAPDSNHLGVFEKTVSSGSLDFIRGVRIELELKGPDGTFILIDDWDPFVACTYCGDVTGDTGVSARDFLTVLGEFGQASSSTSRQGDSLYCTNSNFSEDGYIDQTDLMGYDWTTYLYTEGLIGSFCFPCYHLPLEPCSKSWRLAGEKASAPLPKAGGLTSFRGPLLIAGKRFDAGGADFLSDRLYEFDEDPNLIGGPFAMDNDRTNGKLVRDSDGKLYQINLDEGLVRVSDGNAVIPRGDSDSDVNEPRYGESATVYVGFQGTGESSWGRPILDAAFDSAGYVYVTPVVVSPAVNEPYIASAKLEVVTGDPPYSVLKIFDDAPLPYDNEDPNNCREIEVDDQGRVYIMNKGHDNNSDILRVYDANGTVIKKCHLQNVGIKGPTGLCCSSYDTSRLYVASSLGEPDACSTAVYIISKQDLLQSSGDPNVQTITVNGMGHITDITENPETGKVWAVGFTIPDYIEMFPAALADINEFYEPNLVEIPYGSSGPVQAISLSNANDLALPLSIVYTKRCGWADLDGGDDVDFGDFEIMGGQWMNVPGSPSADIAPGTPDGIVNMLDLAVLAEHWLEKDCSSP